MAPRRRIDGQQFGGPRPGPRRGPVGRERIEAGAEREIARERRDQPRVRAEPVADRKARQREQRVAALAPCGRAAEGVQPVADLRFLQLAEPGVDAREQRVLVALPGRRGHAQFLVQAVLDDGVEDGPAQQLRAPRVHHQRLVVLVHLPLQVLQRPVVLGARERRHQVVDDHGLRAALGLAALAGIVDDERIQVRQRPEHEVGPARVGQRDALARQPFEVAVLADVDDRVDREHVAQPEIEREVGVRRHQIGVVIARVVVGLARARRLDPDEHVPGAPAGDRKAPVAQRRIQLGRAPARLDRLARGGRQARVAAPVGLHREALERRPDRALRRVVGHAAGEPRDQRVARLRQRPGERVAGRAERGQDAERRGRRVEPDAVADPPFAGRIVGQHQREPLVGVRRGAQPAPAPAELGHERHAFGIGLVAHHVHLGVRAAIGEPLEAHGARDDAPVHLGQRHVHGDVARMQPLRVGQPRLAIAARQDHLQHRRVAGQLDGGGRVDRAGRERGGVEHQRHALGRHQPVDHLAAHGVLQRGDGDRQRVEPLAFERLDQRVEHRRVGGLPVGLVEQDRHHRRAGRPARVPVVERGRLARRMVERGGRQRPRRRRFLAHPERMERDAAQQRLRVVRTALAQIAPPLPAQRRPDGAPGDQVRILLQVAREHREPLAAPFGERHRLLDPVGPVGLAAEMVDHHHTRVPQHVVDIEIDRRRLPQERHVGEPHARETLAEQRHGAREQRQRGVRRAEDHDLGGTLVDPDHALRVVDEAARRGAQQMHGGGGRVRPPARRRARP